MDPDFPGYLGDTGGGRETKVQLDYYDLTASIMQVGEAQWWDMDCLQSTDISPPLSSGSNNKLLIAH
jgi:hypothetical protein